MLLGQDEIAARMQYQHWPWWRVWYGHHTAEYWALARWVNVPLMLSAPTPTELDAAIATFEMHYPKPTQKGARRG